MADRLRRAVDALGDRSTSPHESRDGTRVNKKAATALAATAAASAATAGVAALEAQGATLLSAFQQTKDALADSQEEVASLKQVVGDLRSEVQSLRESADRVSSEVKNEAVVPIAQLRNELQATANESISLKAQVTMLDRGLSDAQSVVQDHTQQLRDVAILRAQQQYVQAAADRADIAAADLMRQLTEQRAELAALQQRHASAAGGSAAEHAAHRQAQAVLRSAHDASSLQLEALQAAVGALQASEATTSATSEKLKKSARRHEMLVAKLGETHEARAGELRGLVKTVADQLRPLHETSRRHAAQIEEISSGINVLAELLKFTNRGRTQSLADALEAS